MDTENDPVNSPKHYRVGNIETIDFIEAKKLDFHLGNVVKYISRHEEKHSDPKKQLEDLKKARWYLERKINKIEEITERNI